MRSLIIRTVMLTAGFVSIPAGASALQVPESETTPGFNVKATANPDAPERPKASPPVPEPPALTPLPELLQKQLSELVPLNPEATVLIDMKQKRVLLRTQVACDDCPLEMLCCLEQTKEHESILWLRARAEVVHAALLAVGAVPGSPARFLPEFVAPTGPGVRIFVNWVDENGKLQRADARTWMRTSVSRYYSKALPAPPPNVELPFLELRYDPFNKEILWYGPMSKQQRSQLEKLWSDKAYLDAIAQFFNDSQSHQMDADFVFTGSYHFVIEETGEKRYAAEQGDLVCVANFASALIDVRQSSSADDGGVLFEAWPERIPPRETPVILELIPKVDSSPAPALRNQESEDATPKQDRTTCVPDAQRTPDVPSAAD